MYQCLKITRRDRSCYVKVIPRGTQSSSISSISNQSTHRPSRNPTSNQLIARQCNARLHFSARYSVWRKKKKCADKMAAAAATFVYKRCPRETDGVSRVIGSPSTRLLQTLSMPGAARPPFVRRWWRQCRGVITGVLMWLRNLVGRIAPR